MQMVDRVAKALRALASDPYRGLSFTEFGREIELGKSTTHRLLKALVHSGLAHLDTESRRYHLGALVGLLGNGAVVQSHAAACRAAIESLAEVTGDTVYASTVEGYGAVCIARATGKFPIRTLVLDVGDWRPLGVGAGSLALLAAQADDRVAESLAHNAPRLKAYLQCTPDSIKALVRKTRANGYSFMTGQVVPGMSAVGMAVLDSQGQPACAISIAAINERMSADRVEDLAELLKKRSREIQTELARRPAA